jgi:hypothetical protein
MGNPLFYRNHPHSTTKSCLLTHLYNTSQHKRINTIRQCSTAMAAAAAAIACRTSARIRARSAARRHQAAASMARIHRVLARPTRPPAILATAPAFPACNAVNPIPLAQSMVFVSLQKEISHSHTHYLFKFSLLHHVQKRHGGGAAGNYPSAQ